MLCMSWEESAQLLLLNWEAAPGQTPPFQCPMGAAPLQLLRKGLASFPPVLEILMSAGKVAGSSLWA